MKIRYASTLILAVAVFVGCKGRGYQPGSVEELEATKAALKEAQQKQEQFKNDMMHMADEKEEIRLDLEKAQREIKEAQAAEVDKADLTRQLDDLKRENAQLKKAVEVLTKQLTELKARGATTQPS